ncbi:MAG: right-handed parallel beta-helix repeat-containing protein [Planctomycetota bacterium]
MRASRDWLPKAVVFVWLATFLSSCRGTTLIVATPDSAGIQLAIDSGRPGDTIVLPPGTYSITEAIKPKSGTRLLGSGQGKTIIRFVGKAPDVLMRIAGCEDVEAAHLTLDGENNPLLKQGILGTNSRRVKIHHVTVRNLVKSETWGPHGILFTGKNPTRENAVSDSEIADCLIENIATDAKFGCGIRMAWGSSRNRILRNTIRNTGRGGIFGDNGSNDLIIRENTVAGSGGEGLGIEVWGRSDRCVIEDNRIDHWLSVGGSDFCAVRRNVVEDKGGPTKPYGLEIIGSYCIVSDNTVGERQGVGVSVSSKMPKNYHFYARNTIRGCYHWGAQFQGEEGGIARCYLYRCKFLDTMVGHPSVRYKGAEGNGFRTNGNVKQIVFEECDFSDNAKCGLQLGGPNVDQLSFVRCTIRNNKFAAVVGPKDYTALEWIDCAVEGNGKNDLPPAKPFAGPPPTASFDVSEELRVGKLITFVSTSKAATGKIAAVMWDFGDGIPVIESRTEHTYSKPGEYRVTLLVWDDAGRGARAEKVVRVAP